LKNTQCSDTVGQTLKLDYSLEYNIQLTTHSIEDGHHWTFDKIKEGIDDMLLVDSTDATALVHYFYLVDFSGPTNTTCSNRHLLGPALHVAEIVTQEGTSILTDLTQECSM
jgi:hypothetical protein